MPGSTDEQTDGKSSSVYVALEHRHFCAFVQILYHADSASVFLSPQSNANDLLALKLPIY